MGWKKNKIYFWLKSWSSIWKEKRKINFRVKH